MFVNTLRKDAPLTVAQLLGVSGMFAGISFLLRSPIIAAVIVIEATGVGGAPAKSMLIAS